MNIPRPPPAPGREATGGGGTGAPPRATALPAWGTAIGLACLAGGAAAAPGPPITLTFEGTNGRPEISDFYFNYGITFESAFPIGPPNISGEPSPSTAAAFTPYYSMTMSSLLPIGGQVNFYLSTMTDIAIQLYSDTEGRGTPVGRWAFTTNYNLGCENRPGFCNFQSLFFPAPTPFRSMVFLSLNNDSASARAVIDNLNFTPLISSPTPVPEPAGWTVLLAGMAGVHLARRWRRRAQAAEGGERPRTAAGEAT